MSFYLRPPKGLTNLHKLEESVTQRLACYENLACEEIVELIYESECLIEDSILDRSGHYVFRLLASQSRVFYATFIENETKLLKIRLRCYEKGDLRRLVKKLNAQTVDCLETAAGEERIGTFFNSLKNVLRRMLGKGYFDHAFGHDFGTCGGCGSYRIAVARREVAISSGFLNIESFDWSKLLLSLYRNYLMLALDEMKHSAVVSYALDDDRIQEVLALIKNVFLIDNPRRHMARFTNVEEEFRLFPLCMENLYRVLQKKNRLSHNARFNFSLFLKDIGMKLDDSMKFWESAYSKRRSVCSSCAHSWQGNEERYIYGIRHMYGLEGSRRSYSVKSCQQIEELTLGANEEGGCPFKHFDDACLRNALRTRPGDEDTGVIIYSRKTSAKKACMMHLKSKLNDSSRPKRDSFQFYNPAEHYLLLKRLMS
ncbi:uncharacterized protein LOC132697684 isoform X2 [Cylas formicarius]|uniref:uncharacterized protein LOC132697684 isoform X2 n=1 Tax=Cylas formicarius TaxID=197179 RepID=UPI002958B0B0|nr:uncharacterized protein LOC132697684 isoform X2 [Cylas formicarius]